MSLTTNLALGELELLSRFGRERGPEPTPQEAAALVDLALTTFRALQRWDAAYHLQAHQSPAETVSPDGDGALLGAYRRWLTLSAPIANQLDRLAPSEHGEHLRAALREVNGILTDDDAFFSAEHLVELQERAVDDYTR